jgi:hypothetical protein
MDPNELMRRQKLFEDWLTPQDQQRLRELANQQRQDADRNPFFVPGQVMQPGAQDENTMHPAWREQFGTQPAPQQINSGGMPNLFPAQRAPQQQTVAYGTMPSLQDIVAKFSRA